MDKLIFLDIDGVLNHDNFYKNHTAKELNEWDDVNDDEWGQMFCPKSTQYINDLTDATGGKVVLSSTKRMIKGDLNYMKQMWVNRGFTGEFIGITPKMFYRDPNFQYGSVQRGAEIQVYLEKVQKFRGCNWSEKEARQNMIDSNLFNYIIIDDDSDMLYNQRQHFIHVLPPPRHYAGFDELYRDQAIETLNTSWVDLHYK